ncbi:HP0495 family protein [Campylobacter geochelonis]|uniref:HP0495 family protein n=1 Tax=Campylobacter geochelonis TaxID=1780362 RepID=UPI0007709B3C|nr:DUF493 domain-containing protein [Campylobacter geochelonis]CZE46003.1 putative methyl-accepting chemotaxis sensory transducer with Pas/Pac sensor [Campylobacter geochelonis]
MASICELNSKKPEISYPNFWEYKVIMDSKEHDEKKLEEIVANKEHKISFSKHSNGGKYMSFNVSVLVNSEAERVELFEKFKKISKFVL